MFRAMALSLVLLLSCSFTSGALGSPGLLLSSSIVTISLHITIILTMACCLFFYIYILHLQVEGHARELFELSQEQQREIHALKQERQELIRRLEEANDQAAAVSMSNSDREQFVQVSQKCQESQKSQKVRKVMIFRKSGKFG